MKWQPWEKDFFRLTYPDHTNITTDICSFLSNRSALSLNDQAHIFGLIRCDRKSNTKFIAEIPEMLLLWDDDKNWNETKDHPMYIPSNSGKKYYFKCKKGHSFQSPPDRISTSFKRKKSGCPYCNGKKVDINNCLITTHPNIAKYWDYKENKDTPYDITCCSHKKRYFKCEKGIHPSYLTCIHNKTNGKKCVYCAGLKICLENCLSTTHPKIAKEWHPTKNGSITPYDIVGGTNKKYWWQCQKCRYGWQGTPGHRCGKDKTGCFNLKINERFIEKRSLVICIPHS